MKIRYSWENKNATIESVTKSVESFFASKNFIAKRREGNQQNYILASGPNEEGSYVRIDARIFCEGDKLFVELSAGEGPLVKLSGLTRLLFGGYPTLQAIKAEEMLTKLEPEFYEYVGERISNPESQSSQ